MFPDTWVFVDLEVVNGDVREIGATRGGRSFRTKRVGSASLAEFSRFAAGATLVIGHHAWAHDREYLAKLPGLEALNALPVLDTLPLSVVSHPERPYHALVKDYKLVRTSVSDPTEDCRLCETLLHGIGVALRQPTVAQRFAVAALAAAEPNALGQFCAWLGMDPPTLRPALREVAMASRDASCVSALTTACEEVHRGARAPLPLAYALLWVSVAGTGSVLPRWVREQYPDASATVRALRVSCCTDANCTWCRTTNDENAALRKWFGFDAFRAEPKAQDGSSLQAAIVRNGLGDVPTFAVLPTGGGKSICFQLPALARAERTGALTVVVSPLQSLMKDQVDNLREQAANTVGEVNGSLTMPERARTLAGIVDGRIGLLYVSPEQLRNRSVRQALTCREIGAWVFDEAHCLAKWGHDFRTDYLHVLRFIRELSQQQQRSASPPVFCFTATAQRAVVREVCDYVKRETGQSLDPLLGGIERTNLTYQVIEASAAQRLHITAELLAEHLPAGRLGSAVVFASTRRETEQTAEALQGALNDPTLPVSAYHAGLDPQQRRELQDDFIAAERAVMVATSAFGMGVDKPDVRLVVHLSMPSSLESYLQQAGRAGRDRNAAHCVLLFASDDADKQFQFERHNRLNVPDIQAIHRSVRRAPSVAEKDGDRKAVVTHVELMRIGSARARFDPDDAGALTRVSTAVSWLERAKLLRRDENITRVFQGVLRTQTLDEALQRLEVRADLSQAMRATYKQILRTLVLSDPDEALSADELAIRSGLWRSGEDERQVGAGNEVLKILRDLVGMRLLNEATRFTAFVRHGIADNALQRFAHLRKHDRALRALIQELAGGVGEGEALHADFALLVRQVFERLGETPKPADLEQLRALWASYERDADGFAGAQRTARMRFLGRSQYRVHLEADLAALAARRDRFLNVARVVLQSILGKLADGVAGADLLVAFETQDLILACEADVSLAPELRQTAQTVESVLLLLHDARVLTLQNGMAVFRQAMTIRHHEDDRRRQFRKQDFEPLAEYYASRTLQIHVMAEYARLGCTDMDAALRLALDWFELERDLFLARWMPGRKASLARATTPESYAEIVTALGHDEQVAIVTAPADANQLVLAGPGSGKTRVIVHRIAYLVRVCGLEPAGILALAYNRAAALEIRRRLRELIGEEASWVRVRTLHGLAAELVGHLPNIETQRPQAADDAFRALIVEAAELLESGVDGGQSLRESLLGGCSHLLIDEYQDIDAMQARLVSALSGRLLDDGRKLCMLAVGDDDQNIYGFRGADTKFIKAFAEEFEATTVSLLDNFRSTQAIVDAANHVIERAPARLKSDTPIRVAGHRRGEPYGGPWEAMDPVSQGRVRIVHCKDDLGVGEFVAVECLRMAGLDAALDAALDASPIAVLGRTRAALYPVREALRMRRKPSRWSLPHGQGVPVTSVREVASVMEWLHAQGNRLVRIEDVRQSQATWASARAGDPWVRLMNDELIAWQAAYGDEPVLAPTLAAAIRDSVADHRRSHAIGIGPTLNTFHASKGLEFDHVFVLPGTTQWASENDADSERRAFYVAMTRARKSLTVVVPRGGAPRWAEDLAGAANVATSQWVSLDPPDAVTYRLLGLGDLWLDWAGRQRSGETQEALDALRYGLKVRVRQAGSRVAIFDSHGRQVATLSERASNEFADPASHVVGARVLAVLQRSHTQVGEGYRAQLKRDAWSLPIVELRLRADAPPS